MIKYSIVIPTYNRVNDCNMLLKSIDEAVIYSKIPKREFEIIVVDDSGKNNTYSSSLLVIKNIVNKKRLYASGSRNAGASKAKGQYLIFFDDDVVIAQTYFSQLIKCINNFNCDVISGPIYPQEKNNATLYYTLLLSLTRKMNFVTCNHITMEVKTYKKHPFPVDVRYCEDFSYFLQNKLSILYNKDLIVWHDRISFSSLIAKIHVYTWEARKIFRNHNRWFTNVVIETGNASLRKKYAGLHLWKKTLLRILFAYNILLWVVVVPNLVIRYWRYKNEAITTHEV